MAWGEAAASGEIREWQVPPAAATADRRLAWLNAATEEGNAWLRTQRGYADFRKSLDTISGVLDQRVPDYRSKLNTNHLKRNVREIVGALSKLRPLWGYSSDNPTFAPQAHIMNQVTKAWWLESFADVSIKEALQYAAATCTGWARPIYRRDLGGMGHGNLILLTYGSPCVLPIQLPASGDPQQAYACTILEEMPIWMAHAMFPNFQEQLRPTASLYWYSNEIRQTAKGNLWKRMFQWGKTAQTSSGLSDLMIPIRYTYIIDLTVNKTGFTIPMGEPGTSWYYEVPSLDSTMANGQKATIVDARLYPHRRLIISSESVIMYDGPSFDLHGRLPAIPFSLDKWPWEPIGFSLIRDGFDIQVAVNELERGFMDKERARMDPALAYDINAVSKKEAMEYDPMQPRARTGYDGGVIDKPFTMPIPPEILKNEAITLEFINHLKQTMDEQHAIKDAMALARSRMAGDDMEKVLEALGPIIEDMSRSMEPPIRELANQVKFSILQFYDTARVMQISGPDEAILRTFDYDPKSMVPSHMPGEDPGAEDKPKDSAYGKSQRIRILASNMRFLINPRSIHEITQLVMKLGLIQLKKAGVQIDSQTIAESWGVPNYGTIEGSTVRERWKREQEENLEFAARMKELGMSLSEMSGMNAGGAGAAGKQQEGRSPTGQAAPSLKQKTDGRATVTESKGGGRVV